MTPAEELANAQTMLAAAQAAYLAALKNPQYVQVNTRRVAAHDPAKLREDVDYWLGRVRYWDVVVNGADSLAASRPGLNPPLRVNL